MIPLREQTPTRRPNPTLNPVGDNWRQHKPELKEDFSNHCGYCHSYDGYKHTFFEVDHFVPKSLIIKNGWAITLTQYDNLVYSCKFCNNKKLSKWTTNSPNPPNNGNTGFVDPCSSNYDTHFYRTTDGAIRPRTNLGQWMFRVAFKFDERERAIVVLWNMNRLRQIIEAIAVELKKYPEDSNDYKEIYKKLGNYTTPYYFYHKELIEFYEQ